MSLTRRGVTLLITTAILAAAWGILGLRDLGYVVVFLGACLLIAAAIAAMVRVPGGAAQAPLLRQIAATTAVGHEHTARASVRLGLAPVTVTNAHWVTGGGHEETRHETLAVLDGSRLLAKGAVASSQLSVRFARRGHATVRLVSVECEDPLGLVRRRVTLGATADVLVVPKLLARADGVALAAAQASGHGPVVTVAAGDVGEPGADIREYRAGDSVRQVHWKQSARQRSLFVRLPEKESQRVADVYLPTASAAYVSADQFEHAVSAAATAGARQISVGNAVRLRAGSAEPEVFTTAAGLMRRLAVVQLDGDQAAADD